MESSKVKSKETEQLQKRFKKLEQEWNTFKECNSTTSTTITTTYSRKLTLPLNQSIKKPHRYSPRELMFNLQQESPSPTEARNNATMMTRTNDVAVQEILQGRREAIERGKLKGRRLFQSDDESESALASSPEREVRLMSSFKDDESSGRERVHDNCTRGFYSSSSSSSCPVGGDNDHDVEVVANLVATIAEMRIGGVGRRTNRNTKYAYFLGGVAVIFLALAVCMSLARSSGGDDCSLILVPT